jgi:hypothetical protein
VPYETCQPSFRDGSQSNRDLEETMRTKHLVAGPAMISLLSGCSSDAGRAFSSSNAAQILSGVTDKAAVERALGPPYRRQIAADGSETWLYYYNHLSGSLGPTVFIPIVGPLLPNSSSASSDTQQLTSVASFGLCH